ncbi:cytochrome-c peroxidase [Flavitalea sp.]|nr:cytochrome c peroxidase [Flavitalea sp.]
MSRIFTILFLVIVAVFLTAGSLYRYKEPTPLTINYPAYFGNRITIPADNPTTEEGVKLGRMLFYDPLLSSTNRISCATCHQQKFAFTDGKVFSEGVDGKQQPRNTMSLSNLLWVRQFFWDGRVKGLEKQAETPLTGEHEMGQSLEVSALKLSDKGDYATYFEKAFGSREITGLRITYALSQFERTLISSNAPYDKYLGGNHKLSASEENGMHLFYTNPDPSKYIRGAGCGNCHGGTKTYSELFQNNGLEPGTADEDRQTITGQPADESRFRVVTLRNIALTQPYMHDGRFKTLEEVLDHYNEHIKQSPTLSPFLKNNSNIPGGQSLALTKKEKEDLISFLNALTDSAFISDPSFSDPFK